MLRTVLLSLLILSFSGCASDGWFSSESSAESENQRLKSEAAALRSEVEAQRQELESLKAR